MPVLLQEWWTYVCMGPSDPHPNWHLGMRGTQHRAVMWRVWKEGGTGFLYWGANCYEKATVPSEEVIFFSLYILHFYHIISYHNFLITVSCFVNTL